MKRLTTTVEYLDGTTTTVTAIPADQIAYDLEARRRDWPPLVEAASLATVYIAWRGLKRTQATAADFDEWLESVAAYETTFDEARPTHGAPHTVS